MKNFIQHLRAFYWGEATLWVLFVLTGFSASSGSDDTTMTLAGLFLLAAIGVRATRLPKVKRDDADA
jgi:hypothetical protein